MTIRAKIGQLFENKFNCYVDTTDESVVLAMDKNRFVDIVEYLLANVENAEELLDQADKHKFHY